jgi:histidinol-phosphatase (PHP family)
VSGEEYPNDCWSLITLQEFKQMGGRFTLSDDSHGVEQVALNYDRAWSNNVLRAGLTELYHLEPTTDASKLHDPRFPKVCWKRTSVTELETHAFFKN